MEKTCVLTITDNNYGNRLQHYAVCKILNDNNFFTYSIENFCSNLSFCCNESKSHYYKSKFKLKIRIFLGSFFKKYKRDKNFHTFNRQFNWIGIYPYNGNIKRIAKKFSYYFVGSDQIWNPNFFDNKMLYINMLGFVPAEKRIAVAPSISADSLTDEQTAEFKKYLCDFKALSCREQQGADLIAKVTGKECPALIDPTLMLSQEDWDKVSKKPKFHDENKKYILLYFLGQMTEGYKQIIKTISEKYGLEVIDIYDKKSKYFSCGPSEFIWMIKHCSIMLTDSFHGSVFSYIYEKPFRIFKRAGGESMNSRLTNLMDKLHLDDSVYLSEGDSLYSIFEINYDKKYLLREQENFKNYLDKAFS